ADESEIESTANGGAGERDEARNPFFRGFGADAYSEAFDDERREFFDELLFGEVLAEIDSGSGSGGEPELTLLLIIAKIETIKQAKALDEAQRDHGEQARIRDDGNHSAEAESGAFEKSEAAGISNQNFGNGVQSIHGHVAEMAEIVDVNAVLLRK